MGLNNSPNIIYAGIPPQAGIKPEVSENNHLKTGKDR
jgi:hypothetical protein